MILNSEKNMIIHLKSFIVTITIKLLFYPVILFLCKLEVAYVAVNRFFDYLFCLFHSADFGY